MGRFEGEVIVKKNRRDVYGYLMDLQTRSAFMPTDWSHFRLTSVNPSGVGATLEFDVAGAKPVKGLFILTGVLPPEGITELGHIGDVKWTLRYSLDERDDGSTAIRMIIEYTVASLLKMPLDRFVYAPMVQRWHTAILQRLQRALDGESSAETAARTARHASTYVGAQHGAVVPESAA